MITDEDLLDDDETKETLPFIKCADKIERGYYNMLIGERIRAVIDPSEDYSPILVFESGYGMELTRCKSGSWHSEDYLYRVRFIPRDIIDKAILERKNKLQKLKETYEEFELNFPEYF
jgi:hypothetical protein